MPPPPNFLPELYKGLQRRSSVGGRGLGLRVGLFFANRNLFLLETKELCAEAMLEVFGAWVLRRTSR